jgi:hypothetical protein
MTYATALRFEASGWPSWWQRREFWSRPDVPEALRPGARPDPRELLRANGPSEEQAAAHAERLREWRAARLAWLRSAVEAAR